MNATRERDYVCDLARSDPKKALDHARRVSEAWFRAQALSWVARFTDANPVAIACEAAQAAEACDDDFKKSAVRAWEIAALAERGYSSEARERLSEALERCKNVTPASSRSEALLVLLQAALTIHRDDASKVYEILTTSCPADEHWRCKRAVRDGGRILSGELKSRPFFW